ncbi:hypothetical protein [Altibacter sp.]|uniref:hypothetical protein n=1 Tax=Altibacter sp. TaxID=2024823 RepID=UPI000C8BEB91|nr:hypothetical protein [Altibacter sp.]MAP55490.1 hypothetical protein [Altibacter sp.]|tara:strand:- start:255 stop:626 length:372 start_codon:yes stop_codon:yes gene_type:complete
MKLIVLFTALLILAKPLWPVAEYVMNYDFIVERLCENRGKPEMECNGKCYLSKQLSKEAGDSQNNPFEKSSAKDFLQQWVRFEERAIFQFLNLVSKTKKTIHFRAKPVHSGLFAFALPKPPEV